MNRLHPLVAVVLCLVRPFDIDPQVVGLFLCQLGQLCTDLVEMQTGYLFIEVFGQGVNVVFVFIRVTENFDLRQHLVGE